MQPDPLLPDRSLPALFERCARSYADRVALLSERGELTFAELNLFANRLAHRLIAAGGSRGDRVAVLKTQDLASYASMLAILKAGRVMLALNPDDPAARLRELLADAEPTVIITDARDRDRSIDLAAGRTAVILADDDLSGLPGSDPVETATLRDLAALVYTSGTTGRPKGVMQTHGQIMRNARMNVRAMNITATDGIVLVAAPWGGQGIDTVWVALSAGARLLSHPASVNGVTGLAESLAAHRITIYPSAASLFRHFMRSIDDSAIFPDVRFVRVSSDPPTAEDFHLCRRHFPNAEMAHDAGMSEVGRIGWMLFPRDAHVAAGRLPLRLPPEGITTRIVSETGDDVPPGTVGSIALASPHMALGYWRDPDLTARHFSTGPDGMRVFRGGDLGRIDEAGLLYLVGRKDAAHKIRGQRVDLNEVERGLSRLPGVGQVAAGIVPRANGEPQLVAYVVALATEAPTPRKLRAVARALLPRHLVPSAFLLLDRMPLAGNGKVDRQRLRELTLPSPDGSAQPPAGRTETELARIWQEAFDLDGIGRAADFFDLGGNSLIAAVIGARAQATFGVELHFASFVEHPQLADMAAFIEASGMSTAMPDELPPVPMDRPSPVPLSPLQLSFWRGASAPHNAGRWTVASAMRLEGPLDVEAFRGAVADVVARHDMLRTRFPLVDGSPAQVVEPATPLDLPLLDYGEFADGEDRVTGLLEAESRRVFDFRAAPPLKLILARTGTDRHWLIEATHHIISDAFSWLVFVEDLGIAYSARVSGTGNGLSPLPVQFADFSVWHRRLWRSGGPRSAAALAWWEREFRAGLVPTRFPLRKKLPAGPLKRDDWLIARALDPATSRGLDALGHQEGATFYIVRLTGMAPVVARLTGRDDAIVGGVFTKRNRLSSRRLFGPLANLATLPLRCNWSQSYRAFVRTIRDRVAELQPYADMPNDDLHAEMAARGMAITPPPVMIHVHTPHPPVSFAGLQLSWQETPTPMPRGITIGFDQFREEWGCYIVFDARLFDRETMNRVADGMVGFFEAAVRHPDRTLDELVELAGIRPL